MSRYHKLYTPADPSVQALLGALLGVHVPGQWVQQPPTAGTCGGLVGQIRGVDQPRCVQLCSPLPATHQPVVAAGCRVEPTVECRVRDILPVPFRESLAAGAGPSSIVQPRRPIWTVSAAWPLFRVARHVPTAGGLGFESPSLQTQSSLGKVSSARGTVSDFKVRRGYSL